MDPGLLEQYKAYLMCAAQFGNVWKPYWSALSRWVIRCFAHTAQGPLAAAAAGAVRIQKAMNGLLFRKSWKRCRLGGNDLIEVLLDIFGCEMGQKIEGKKTPGLGNSTNQTSHPRRHILIYVMLQAMGSVDCSCV